MKRKALTLAQFRALLFAYAPEGAKANLPDWLGLGSFWIEDLKDRGLLVWDCPTSEHNGRYRLTDRGRAYVDAGRA